MSKVACIYTSPLFITSQTSISNSIFMSFTETTIVCQSYLDVYIDKCMFFENSRFGNAGCIDIREAKSSQIIKCVARNCFTYVDNSAEFSDGQFCYVNLSYGNSYKNNLILSSVCSCAPFFDGKERRSVCFLRYGEADINDLNLTNNYVIQQILFCAAPATIKFVTSAKNTLERQDLMYRQGVGEFSDYNVVQSNYSQTLPVALYFENSADARLTSCAVVSDIKYKIETQTGAKAAFTNCYLDSYEISTGSDVSVGDKVSTWATKSHLLMRDIALEVIPQSSRCDSQIPTILLSMLIACKSEEIVMLYFSFSSQFHFFASQF